jgi:hypothetical protein
VDYSERVIYAHNLTEQLVGGDVLDLGKHTLPRLEVWPEWYAGAGFGIRDVYPTGRLDLFIRLGAFTLDAGLRLNDWDWLLAHELGHWEDFVVNHRGNLQSWHRYRVKDLHLPYSTQETERYADYVAFQLTGKKRKDVLFSCD